MWLGLDVAPCVCVTGVPIGPKRTPYRCCRGAPPQPVYECKTDRCFGGRSDLWTCGPGSCRLGVERLDPDGAIDQRVHRAGVPSLDRPKLRLCRRHLEERKGAMPARWNEEILTPRGTDEAVDAIGRGGHVELL